MYTYEKVLGQDYVKGRMVTRVHWSRDRKGFYYFYSLKDPGSSCNWYEISFLLFPFIFLSSLSVTGWDTRREIRDVTCLGKRDETFYSCNLVCFKKLMVSVNIHNVYIVCWVSMLILGQLYAHTCVRTNCLKTRTYKLLKSVLLWE